MILGYHFHAPAFRDDAGVLWTDGAQGRFVESIADRCERVVCFFHGPAADERPRLNYRVRRPNVELVALGLRQRLRRRLVGRWQPPAGVHSRLTDLDALLIRIPTPLTRAIAAASDRVPLVIYQTGHPFHAIAGLERSPPVRWAIKAWTAWDWRRQRRLARRGLVIVNSDELRPLWGPFAPRLREIGTATLRQEDFFLRDDTCGETTKRVLHVGAVNRAKGVDRLADAVLDLLSRGLELRLDVVGHAPPDEAFRREIEGRFAAAGFGDRVRFRGFRRLGDELFECYREADLFVTASLFEGFPRVIWEAMANSLPVVATRVGAIPGRLEHERDALLVEPHNTGALANAMRRVIADGELRRRLIRHGRELAARNTAAAKARELLDAIEAWRGAAQSEIAARKGSS
jgi:glycosyltransferase involved in cell wall biosynthesis